MIRFAEVVSVALALWRAGFTLGTLIGLWLWVK